MDPLKLASIPIRAQLSRELSRIKENFRKSLNISLNYIQKTSTIDFDKKQERFHLGNLLVGLLSIFEAYLSDSLFHILISFPSKVEKKSKERSFEQFAIQGSLLRLIEDSTKQIINEYQYKKFSEFFDIFCNHTSITPPLTQNLDIITEARATRDLLVHNGGKINSIYINKTGSLSRGKMDTLIPLDKNYINKIFTTCQVLEDDISNKLEIIYTKYNYANAINEMWTSSALNKLIPFSEAWLESPTQHQPDLLRPTDFAREWGWSSTETELYNFFLFIYSGKPIPNIPYLIDRWALPRPEAHIIMAWIERPFRF